LRLPRWRHRPASAPSAVRKGHAELMEWSRTTNDEIRRVAERFHATPKETYDFWCECGCRYHVRATIRRFDSLRRLGQPLLLPGHVTALATEGRY
jgi:hypothetical protein